MRLTNDAGHA